MLHENLKLKRKEKGLSQEELAAKLHVVRQTISKWEKGSSVPDAELLIRLSEILDTPVGALLGSAIEPAADRNVISQQLEQINATLAARNRRSKLVWRVLAILLAASVLFYLLSALIGVISFQNVTHLPETVVVEEIEP